MLQDERLGEYTCPICELDLAQVKSSYSRQQHVEKCLTTNETKTNEFEINDCIFCGKILSHFKYNQKQVHLNTCLDNIKEEEEEVEMFAGQSISFLNTLEICPVCHEITPFLNRNINQKLKHIKKCSKQHKLSISQLLQKFQWIGWGHLPIANETIPSTTFTPKPTHTLTTNIIQDDDFDNDFCNNVIIHKTNNQLKNNRKRNRQKDKIDEELQLAIGLSKSMSMKEVVSKKQCIRVTPLNERDWNAANIWSAEESKKQVICKLDELLFHDNIELESFKQQEREKSIGYLGQSKLKIDNNLFYWKLSSKKIVDPSVFKSLLLQNRQFES